MIRSTLSNGAINTIDHQEYEQTIVNVELRHVLGVAPGHDATNIQTYMQTKARYSYTYI
jgi:hypothetical protein